MKCGTCIRVARGSRRRARQYRGRRAGTTLRSAKKSPNLERRRARLQADGGAELVGAVDALPGEIGLGAAEVPVGRRLRVDRAEQVQRVDDGSRPQGEDLQA